MLLRICCALSQAQYLQSSRALTVFFSMALGVIDLPKMKRFFIADDDTSGAYAELDMKQFSDVSIRATSC